MDRTKRERSVNFTPSESNLLLSLIMKYRSDIATKQTGAVSWRRKENSWRELTAEFNLKSEVPRTPKSLKSKYDNMKKKLRKDLATEKVDVVVPGVGNRLELELDETNHKLLSILSSDQDSSRDVFDCDEGSEEHASDGNHSGSEYDPEPTGPQETSQQLIEIKLDNNVTLLPEQSSDAVDWTPIIAGQQDEPAAVIHDPLSMDAPTFTSPEPVILIPPTNSATSSETGLGTGQQENPYVKHNWRSPKKRIVSRDHKPQKCSRLTEAKLQNMRLQNELLRVQILEQRKRVQWGESEHQEKMKILRMEYERKQKLLQLDIKIKQATFEEFGESNSN